MPDISDTAAMREFGHGLQRLRLHALLTQDQLAGLSGLHPKYLADLEAGRRNPSLRTLIRLYGVLGYSVADLLPPAHAVKPKRQRGVRADRGK